MKPGQTLTILALLALAGCDSPIVVKVAPNPSLTHACLATGLSEYSVKQLEQADFCSPGGDVTELVISDRNAWTARIQKNRVAFGPVGDDPKPAIVIVTTPTNQYQFKLVR